MPLRRFANPTALNAASGWLFVNDPENVQYLCATNVRNYGRRYLPDIYKWVTHEKGILGSQARLDLPQNASSCRLHVLLELMGHDVVVFGL